VIENKLKNRRMLDSTEFKSEYFHSLFSPAISFI